MTPQEARDKVAKNCFAYSGETSKMVEADAAVLLLQAARRDRDSHAYRAGWATGLNAHNGSKRGSNSRQYEATILAVVDHNMTTRQVRDAIVTRDPDAWVPENLSQALRDMARRGLINCHPGARHHSVWSAA